MRFSELRPDFRNPKEPVTIQNAWGVQFDCPQCKRDGEQRLPRIYLPLGPPSWDVSPQSTSMHDVTITPSVRMLPGHHCLGHWNITNGEVIFHPDSHCAPRVRIRLPTHVHIEHHHGR